MHIGRQMLAGAAIAMVASFSVPASADVKTGIAAWARGDFVAAVKEWRADAERGDPDAQFNLGQAYRLGRGVPADLRIAQSWFQKAAAKGHEQAQGNYGLLLYEAGKRREALPLLRKASDRGDPRAQYVVGIELTNGELIAKDWPRAYALMTLAAGKGLPAAARSLAKMDEFVPPAERQRGVALARQIERGASSAPATMLTAPAKPAPSKTVAIAKAPVPTPAPAAVKPAPAAAAGGWRVQLGAYGSPAAAAQQWAAISRKVGALAGLRPSYEKAGTFTRLRAGPLADRAAVNKICAAAKAAGQACLPVAP